jgi:hypothetical protein
MNASARFTVVGHLLQRVGEQGRPVAVAPVRAAAPVGSKLPFAATSPALVVDGAFAPEVQVVLRELALRAALTGRASMRRGPLADLFRSTEGHDEHGIVGEHPSDLNRW